MKKPNTKKDLIIVFLCLCVVLMSIGYSILTQRLVINGSTKITGKFDIRITSIEPTENKTATAISKNAEVVNPLCATFSAELLEPKDYIEYLITIKNFGNLDAELSSVLLTTKETNYFKFENYGDAVDNPVLLSGNETTIKVKITFKDIGTMPNSENRIASTNLILNYIQTK